MEGGGVITCFNVTMPPLPLLQMQFLNPSIYQGNPAGSRGGGLVQRYRGGGYTNIAVGVQRYSWEYRSTWGKVRGRGVVTVRIQERGRENKAVFKDLILKGGSAEQLAKVLIILEKYLTANTNIC